MFRNTRNQRKNGHKSKKPEKMQWIFEEVVKECTKTEQNDELNVSISEFDTIPNIWAMDDFIRMGFPRNIALNISKIDRVNYLNNFKTSIIPIQVTQVHSPFKFWFTHEMDTTKVSILMENMQRFYTECYERCNDQFKMVENVAIEGRCCAALYDFVWHRAIIVKDAADDKVTVMYFDFGTISTVPMANIRFLLAEFLEVPYTLMRGRLALVAPQTEHWLTDKRYSTEIFLDMVHSKTLIATLYAYEEDEEIYHLVLHDRATNPHEPISINEQLSMKGQAYFLTKETELWPHTDEVYPTFQMIETGQFPMVTKWNLDYTDINSECTSTYYSDECHQKKRTVFDYKTILEKYYHQRYSIRSKSSSSDLEDFNNLSSLCLTNNELYKNIPSEEECNMKESLDVKSWFDDLVFTNQFIQEGSSVASDTLVEESKNNPLTSQPKPFLIPIQDDKRVTLFNKLEGNSSKNPFTQVNNTFLQRITNETSNPFL